MWITCDIPEVVLKKRSAHKTRSPKLLYFVCLPSYSPQGHRLEGGPRKSLARMSAQGTRYEGELDALLVLEYLPTNDGAKGLG